MILYRFNGGLGNQMFQYATFYSLQRHYSNQNILADIGDIRLPNSTPSTQLELVYDIKLPYWKPDRIQYNFAYKHLKRSLIYGLKIFSKIGSLNYIKDTNYYNESLFQLDENKNYLIQGYWADQRYFFQYAEELKKIFYPKSPISNSNQEVLNKIRKSDSVSVHIRRGDYLKTNSFLDLNSLDYYEKAFEIVLSDNPNASFFVFSDDMEWSKIKFGKFQCDVHFVDNNRGLNAYWDLFLMSQCKCNILANSTFSWWAGWLNDHKNKKVYCPSRIFLSEKRNQLIVPQFYPGDWNKI